MRPDPKPDKPPPKAKKPIRKVSEKKQKIKKGVTFITAEEFQKLKQTSVKKKGKLRVGTKSVNPEKKLEDAFSKYIRVRDANNEGMCICITSGKLIHWTLADCGHGHGRQHGATKYHEMNNHAQNRKHNRFEEGRKDLYAVNVDKRYGAGTWEMLEYLSRKPLKLERFEIEAMTKYYTDEFERIKKEKGL